MTLRLRECTGIVRLTGIAAGRASASGGFPAVMHHLLAYIDPGSGSLIFQAIIATALAVPFFLRQQIARVVRNLRRGSRPGDDTAA